ncbi:MAG: pitrilysin family protein [Candidatus Saccharibacteria bacterium]
MKYKTHLISLKNGASLLAIDVADTKKFLFNSCFRAGWDYTEPSKQELAHLLEHLAFCGNSKYKTEEALSYEAEKYGVRFNANTSDHLIRYYYNGGINEYEHIIDLATAQIGKPIFSKKDIDNQKKVVAVELSRKKDNDSDRCGYLASQTIMTKFLSIDERIASLNNINRKDIVKYFNQYHVAQNLYFIIAGDLSSGRLSNIESILNKFLETYRTGEKQKWNKKNLGKFNKQILVQDSKLEAEQHFELHFTKKNYNKQLEAPMKIFNTLLGVGFGARLFTKTRQEGLSYGAHSYFEIDEDYSYFIIKDRTQPKNTTRLFDICVSEVAKILDGKFTKEEWERAKGFCLASLEIGFETPDDLEYWFDTDFLEDKPLETPDSFINKLKKVQPKDITKLRNSFFKDSEWLVSLVGKDIGKDQAKYKQIVEKYFG